MRNQTHGRIQMSIKNNCAINYWMREDSEE